MEKTRHRFSVDNECHVNGYQAVRDHEIGRSSIEAVLRRDQIWRS